MRDFDQLLSEAESADVSGWGFGWLAGRAVEQRPPWGFARLLAESAAAAAVGLNVVSLRTARCRMEFFDVGAVVWILRKCVWWVPDFSVARYRGRLAELDALIRRDGKFVAHSTRHLIEARR